MTESMKHGMAVPACLTATERTPGWSGFPRTGPDLGRGWMAGHCWSGSRISKVGHWKANRPRSNTLRT